MTNLKQTSTLIATSLLISLLTVGCEKEDSSSDSKSIEGIFYYFTDEENQKIRVIDLDAPGQLRRSYTLSDDFTLQDLAQEEPHLVLKAYRPSNFSSLANKKGNLIKSKVVEGGWLYVANNPFLGLTGTTDDNYSDASVFANDATGFILHKSGVIDGEDVYAFESVGYPGRFITHSGHPIQGANVLFLDIYPGPEDAPKFRLYNPKSTFSEGDPSVPLDFGL